jgi:hypothetical protein
MRNGNKFYVDVRMKEWGMDEQARRIQTSVRRVLSELDAEALLSLKDPRLEVVVMPDVGLPGAELSVWASFPVHRRRIISRELGPKPQTRVLLVFYPPSIKKHPRGFFEDYLRDALGHVLLYLRSPRAHNGCPDAMREWRRSRRDGH